MSGLAIKRFKPIRKLLMLTDMQLVNICHCASPQYAIGQLMLLVLYSVLARVSKRPQRRLDACHNLL